MPHPKVTVLVCTRDRPKQFLRCLESLVALDYETFDVIVVDNGSQSFSIPSLDYPFRIRFFSQPVSGLSFARNSVLPFVEGEVTALLDDDATADPHWLTKAAVHFNEEQLIGVAGKVLPLQPANECQRQQWSERWAGIPDTPVVFDPKPPDRLNAMVGTGTNLLVRTQFLRTHGFNELFGPGTPVGACDEDELFYRIFRSGGQILYEPEAVVYHEYVEDEATYNKQRKRYGAARGALLTYVLWSWSGMRLVTLRHLARKIFVSRKGPAQVSTRARGLSRGPLALWRSWRWSRKRYAGRGPCSLLKDLPGHNAGVSSHGTEPNGKTGL